MGKTPSYSRYEREMFERIEVARSNGSTYFTRHTKLDMTPAEVKAIRKRKTQEKKGRK